MKKILFCFLAFSGMLIVSCNSNKGKPPDANRQRQSEGVQAFDTCALNVIDFQSPICNRPGIGNLAVSKAEAQPWIDHFRATYKLAPGMQDMYWIDSCALGFLWDFIEAKKTYNGVWVTFACNGAGTNSAIRFLPTYDSAGHHVSDWNAFTGATLPTGCTTQAELFDTNKRKAKNFRGFFRKEGQVTEVTGLSRKVWVDTCVIHVLRMAINAYKTNSTPLDGVFIYSASYNTALPPGRQPPGYNPAYQQSTIVLVPSYNCSNVDGHFPAWEINQYIVTLFKNAMKGVAGPAAAFNHGELCPNSCHTIDD
jgi:hypothetical protein